jgi:hypothetical protein
VLLVQAYFENHWAKNNCQLYIVLKQLQTHMRKNLIQLQNRMVSHNVGAQRMACSVVCTNISFLSETNVVVYKFWVDEDYC